jgi:hypothetical protein
MAALLDGDPEVFVLHAATAFEHLGKARLAKIDPSLISADDFDSKLFFCGARPAAAGKQPKSISVSETVKRLAQIEPAFRPEATKATLNLLAEARNGVAHIGRTPGEGVADSLVVTFAKACDALLSSLDLTREEFWGDYLYNVNERMSEAADKARIAAADKITKAKLAFAERFGSLDADVAKTMLDLVQHDDEEFDDGHVVACPACKSRAFLVGDHDVDYAVESDYADGEEFFHAYGIVTFTAQRLDCGACGLRLDGADELSAGEIEPRQEIEGVEAERFVQLDLDRMSDGA